MKTFPLKAMRSWLLASFAQRKKVVCETHSNVHFKVILALICLSSGTFNRFAFSRPALKEVSETFFSLVTESVLKFSRNSSRVYASSGNPMRMIQKLAISEIIFFTTRRLGFYALATPIKTLQ